MFTRLLPTTWKRSFNFRHFLLIAMKWKEILDFYAATLREYLRQMLWNKNNSKRHVGYSSLESFVIKAFPEPIGVKWTRCVACRLLIL
jgi:hypothetical protein